MERSVIEKVYRRYARVYDAFFGAVLQPGRRRVLERLAVRPAERILEVGVGTGLSLPLYPAGAHVTGVDLSQEMLARAEACVHAGKTAAHVQLARMDAERLAFADDSFDKVVAMYVASVVPSPARLVSEMQRVCRPGGELFIVNHFRNAHPLIRGLERLLAPFSAIVGFHPDFCLEQFVRETGLQVDEQIPVNAFGYWTLLRIRNRKPPGVTALPSAAARHEVHTVPG